MKKLLLLAVAVVMLFGWAGLGNTRGFHGGWGHGHWGHYGGGDAALGAALGLAAGAAIAGCVAMEANKRREPAVVIVNPVVIQTDNLTMFNEATPEQQNKLWESYQQSKESEPNLTWEQFLKRHGWK